jgi:hypothetical protein
MMAMSEVFDLVVQPINPETGSVLTPVPFSGLVAELEAALQQDLNALEDFGSYQLDAAEIHTLAERFGLLGLASAQQAYLRRRHSVDDWPYL